MMKQLTFYVAFLLCASAQAVVLSVDSVMVMLYASALPSGVNINDIQSIKLVTFDSAFGDSDGKITRQALDSAITVATRGEGMWSPMMIVATKVEPDPEIKIVLDTLRTSVVFLTADDAEYIASNSYITSSQQGNGAMWEGSAGNWFSSGWMKTENTVVPEPASALLGMLGFALVALRRRQGF